MSGFSHVSLPVMTSGLAASMRHQNSTFLVQTLKVYCYNSKVGDLGLDWLHILRWWWRKQWCWKRSAAWWFFTASYGNFRVQYHRIKQSGRKIWQATVRTFPGTWWPFQHREKICINVDTNCMVPSITWFTENARHGSFVAAKVLGSKHAIIFVAAYRPPRSDQTYMDTVNQTLSTLCHKFSNMPIWIGGDMNLPDIEWENEQLTTNQYTHLISFSFWIP